MLSVKHGLLIAIVLKITTSIYALPDPRWPSLRTTWGKIPSDIVFAKAPETDFDAVIEGFVQIDGKCAEGKFLGYRYIKDSDLARVLIYDDQGYIAGMQIGIPKSAVLKANVSKPFFDSPLYILDKIRGKEQVYFITAYFIDPGKICSGGRTEREFLEQGIGTNLYLQTGTYPTKDLLEVPLNVKDLEGTMWTKKGCIKTMGFHYMYNVKGYENCTDIFPIFALYYKGNLIGYEWIAVGNYTFSPRIEHLPSEFAEMIFAPNPVPECIKAEINKAGLASTYHVFFYDNPWDIDCPGS